MAIRRISRLTLRINSESTGHAGVEAFVYDLPDGRYDVEYWSEDCFDARLTYNKATPQEIAKLALNYMLANYECVS